MENLPLEITSNILSRLPIVLRLPCRQVCRTWGSLVPRLPRTGLLYGVLNDKAAGHETRAEFYFSEQNNGTNPVDDDDQQLSFLGKLIKYDHSLTMPSSPSQTFMVGSCKGLVCYAADSISCDRTFYICNPVTGEQVQLPAVPWGCSIVRYSEQAIGFGYDRSINKYKVVRITADNNYHGHGFAQVYTLIGGTDWRIKRIAYQNPLSSHLSGLPALGVFAGGALHWIEQDTTKTTIAAFDLEHATLKRLRSIPSVNSTDTKHVRLLMELGGNLCFLEVAPGKHVRIWETSESRQRRRCRSASPWVRGRLIFPWVTKLSIAWEDHSWLEPFAVAESDKWLFWYNAVLSCYDTEAKTLRKLDDTLKKLMDDCTPLVCTTTRATPHMNSLVSLKGVMEEVRLNKRKRILATY